MLLNVRLLILTDIYVDGDNTEPLMGTIARLLVGTTEELMGTIARLLVGATEELMGTVVRLLVGTTEELMGTIVRLLVGTGRFEAVGGDCCGAADRENKAVDGDRVGLLMGSVMHERQQTMC
eukprot:Em0068g15a